MENNTSYLNSIGPVLISTWNYLSSLALPQSLSLHVVDFINTLWNVVELQWVPEAPNKLDRSIPSGGGGGEIGRARREGTVCACVCVCVFVCVVCVCECECECVCVCECECVCE